MRKNKALLNLVVSALTAAMTICGSFGSLAEEVTTVPEEITVTEEGISEEELSISEEIVTETETEEVVEEQISITEAEIVSEEEITEEEIISVSETEIEEIITETVPEHTAEAVIQEGTPEVVVAEEQVPETTEAYLIDSWSGAEQIKDLKGASSPEGSVLTWSAIPDAEGYLIGAIQNGNPYRQIDFIVGGNNTKYVDKNASLTAYSYYWEFPYKKVDGKVVRGNASSKYVYGVKQLPAPQNLKVTASLSGIDISWDPVMGADAYVIKTRIGKDGEVFDLMATDATSYHHPLSSLYDADTYYWVYAFIDNDGNRRPGATSKFAYARTPSDPIKYKPVIFVDSEYITAYCGEIKEIPVRYTAGSDDVYYLNLNEGLVTEWDDTKRGKSNQTFLLTGLVGGEYEVLLFNGFNNYTITLHITIIESELEKQLKQQPVYVVSTFYTVQSDKYKASYPDLMQSMFVNKSGTSIKNVTIAFAAWDKNKLPIKIPTKYDSRGDYVELVTYEGINLLDGEVYGDEVGLAMWLYPVVPAYVKSCIVSYDDFYGNTWNNPLYEAWKQKYVNQILQ